MMKMACRKESMNSTCWLPSSDHVGQSVPKCEWKKKTHYIACIIDAHLPKTSYYNITLEFPEMKADFERFFPLTQLPTLGKGIKSPPDIAMITHRTCSPRILGKDRRLEISNLGRFRPSHYLRVDFQKETWQDLCVINNYIALTHAWSHLLRIYTIWL